MSEKYLRIILCITAILTSNTIFFVPSASAGEKICTVTDPTGTPLNIRNSPNGQVVGKIRNGKKVKMLSLTFDNQGKPWVNIGRGWVLREFISCFSR
jgi:hypothetical protein